MKRGARRVGALNALAAAFLLSACMSSAPQSAAERRREEDVIVQQRASSALARDDLRAAERQYRVALDRARALEDQDGVATGLLNLAAVRHRAGDLSGARTSLGDVIGHQPPFKAEFTGRAEARLALIELQSGRLDAAADHAGRAEALCPLACPWRLALGNVRAEISLRAGDFESAEARAGAALAAAAAAKDVREEASARRLLGELAAARGRPVDARAALLAALDLDRKAESPERIALDLLALARLELAQGERDAARAYARRAADVAQGARLDALLAAARGLQRDSE